MGKITRFNEWLLTLHPLRHPQQRAKSEVSRFQACHSVLALGAPDHTQKSLQSLTFARKEVKAIARLFNAQAYLGKDATESLVWSQAKKAEIVHIAAHGEYDPKPPLFSTIHLAMDDNAEVAQRDGRLEVHDVYKLDLSTITFKKHRE